MKNKRLFVLALAALMIFGAANVLLAADNDAITVNYEVTAINELTIDQASVDMIISTTTLGDPDAVVDSTITYDLSTNCADNGKKITGVLDSIMPADTTLTLSLTAPSGATAAATVTLTATAQDLVTLIDAGTDNDLGSVLTFDATVAAGAISGSRTLTLTLVDQ
jgi:hypothetical protein